jgi:hypothetical protein
MTVKELIDELRKFEPHLEVYTETPKAFDEVTEVRARKWEDQKIVVIESQ